MDLVGVPNVKVEVQEDQNDFTDYYDQEELSQYLEPEEIPEVKPSKRGRKRKVVNYDEDDKPKKIAKIKKKEPNPLLHYKGPIQCYRCGEQFSKLKEAKIHLTETHLVCNKFQYGKPRDFQCPQCKIMKETQEDLDKHNCVLDPKFMLKGENICDICGLTFSSRQGLVNHHKEFHVTECKFVCDYADCDFKTKTNAKLLVHKKRVHLKEKNEVCETCGKTFYNVYELKHHVEFHHTEGKSYICHQCGASYQTKFTLRDHIKTKHKGYLMCSICEMLFRSAKKIQLHYNQKHKIKTELTDHYVCPQCQVNCKSFKELDDHLVLSHFREKNQERCQLCPDEQFCHKITLKMHLLEKHELDFTKTSNTPYINELFNIVTDHVNSVYASGVCCPTCKRMFTCQRSLNDHIREVAIMHKPQTCKKPSVSQILREIDFDEVEIAKDVILTIFMGLAN